MICKNYVLRKCTRQDCRYTHVDNVCSHFFMNSVCKYGDKCRYSHEHVLKRKNTESFVPSTKPSDLRMLVANAGETLFYPYNYHKRDVFFVSNLFNDILYEKLIQEIDENVFKLWHGDSHLIADDHLQWKDKCPLFTKVVDRMKLYFNIDVKATRFNLYRDGSDWKPFHHDAAAIDPNKAKTQNVTIGVSFGRNRSACFEHATTKTTIELPLHNGTIYGFGSGVNMEWRHGITQLTEEERKMDDSGRISIILWGWVTEL